MTVAWIAQTNLEIHAEEVYQFAYRMLGRRVDRDQIQPHIDSRAKERKRLEFFKKILYKAGIIR